MGSRFEITVVHATEKGARIAVEAAFAEIDRLEALISSWRSDSQTSLINRNAGVGPVAVSDDLFFLIERGRKVHNLTGGAFDITVDGLVRLWNFNAAKPVLPADLEIRSALNSVGYQHVVTNPVGRTVFLKKAGVRLGFGAIGKGFAANRAGAVLRDHGASGGVVNAGGDLWVFGRQENGLLWPVSVAHPRKPGQPFAALDVTNRAVVTSGDYERFLMIDGKRYSHIINPQNGYPVEGLPSVTIICPDAELADALATSISVMGQERGLALINRLRHVDAVLWTWTGEVFLSSQIQDVLTLAKE